MVTGGGELEQESKLSSDTDEGCFVKDKSLTTSGGPDV
jgi:hypothetical protein